LKTNDCAVSIKANCWFWGRRDLGLWHEDRHNVYRTHMSDAPQSPDKSSGHDHPVTKASRVGSDLWPRVVSGVVLASVAIALTVAGPMPFAVLVLTVALIVSWEWGRVVRGTDMDMVLAAQLGGVAAGIMLAAIDLPALGVLALAIGTILVALLAIGRNSGYSALGVAFAGLPGIAMLWLRGDQGYGLWAVLYIMLIVVVTDVAAYFSGRLVGGPKLWPQVSPNKTWAGLIGAVIASAVVGWIYATYCPVPAAPEKLSLGGALLAVVAQAGDFAESALKRRFGTKDASQLIPGHGGFMDRVDGLTTAAIAAGLYAVINGPTAPALAILTW
jgi:phosphatidate cytidylyltransferase